MTNKANAYSFSKVLMSTLQDIKAAAQRRDKPSADLQFAFAMGLIGGATLSGGVRKDAGYELLDALEETRKSLRDAFGDAPIVFDHLLDNL
ncbi:TPA: hypothetical protein ACLEB8_004815 [Pseudomonas aeruginosa]